MLSSLLTRTVHEHQHLTRTDHDIVVHIVTIQDGHASRIDVKAVAETRADLAHRHIGDREVLRVRTRSDRHKLAGLFLVIVENAANAASADLLLLVSISFVHRSL